MIDYETLDLLRDTADDVFTSDPAMEQLADLGWLALLTPEELGGDGWHPQEVVAKASSSTPRTYKRIARFGVQLMAEYPVMETTGMLAAQRLRDAWLWSRALTISGGSSEIMRNILARRNLGLPSGQHLT